MAENDPIPVNSDQKILLLCSFIFFMVALMASGVVFTIPAVICLFLIPLFSDSEEKKTSGRNKIAESPSFSTMNANKKAESVSFSTMNTNKVVKKVKEEQKEPELWLELKEIYPDAEKEEYWNNISGTWDLDGLKEDLNLMIKRTGVEPNNTKTSEYKKTFDYPSMTINQLKSILRAKDLPLTGTKAKLIERIKDNITTEKELENHDSRRDYYWTCEGCQKEFETEKEAQNHEKTCSKFLDKKNNKRKVAQKKEKQNDFESEDINRLENLKEIKSMLSEGLIDKSEFNELKKEIFGK